jgi:general secretion pathway protein C
MGLNEIAARLAEPARWIVIGGIAFTLANLVLFFVSPPGGGNAGSEAGARPATRTPDRRPAVSLNAILQRNLFGEAGVTTTPVDNSLPAVETRLPLELLGVAVDDEDGDQSTAIVAQKGRGGQLYNVGEMLPGNAELVEVHADHIVLRRAGTRETLFFPQVSGVAVSTVPEPMPDQVIEQPIDAGADAQPQAWTDEVPSPGDFVAEYRDRLESDPQGTLQEIGISPVSEGSASGYRLDDVAASSPYLSQTGLQPGDVVLSVNGQPVGDIQQDRLQLDNILAQGSARIEVQRGTRRFFVTASLKR